MIPVTITNVAFSNSNGFFVLLKEKDGERTLPIFVGPLEARAIASQLNRESFARPMTHDLFKNVLDVLGCSLQRIEVHDLINDTFYGSLVLACGKKSITVDSRPSDAIALALRFSAPVFVAEKVMDEAGMVLQLENEEKVEEKQPEKPKTRLDEQKMKLDKAIQEERYEDCAKLRDEISKISKASDAN
jgi:hypothetical protein